MLKLKRPLHKRMVRAIRRIEGLLYEPMRPTGVVLRAQKGGDGSVPLPVATSRRGAEPAEGNPFLQ